jgi:hypothetical protein
VELSRNDYDFSVSDGNKITIDWDSEYRVLGGVYETTIRSFAFVLEAGINDGMAFKQHLAKGGKLKITIEPV